MSTDEPATATAPAPAPAPEPASPGKQLMQTCLIVAGALVVANVLFWVLSDRYYAERAAKHGPQELAHLARTRGSFVFFSAAVGLASILAAWQARVVGHLVAGLAGALLFLAGIAAFQTDLSSVLGVTLIVLGGLLPLMAAYAWRGSRAGWAVAVALCGVLGLIGMLAAPTLGRLMSVSLWVTMVLPGVLGVGTAALLTLRDSYRD